MVRKAKQKVAPEEAAAQKAKDFDYLDVLPSVKKKAAPGNHSQQKAIEKTTPLDTNKLKQRINIFHRNGKKPVTARTLLFTHDPYGFRETQIELAKLTAARIKPAKDDKGDIYIVIQEQGELGEPKLTPWPGTINFPVVSSEKLGEALNWPEIQAIDSTKSAGWLTLNSMAAWVIVGVALIVIFMVAYFGLVGG